VEEELINQLDEWTEKQNSAHKELKQALKKFLSQTAYSEELKKEIDRRRTILSEAFNKRMEIIDKIIEKRRRVRYQQRL
jgi:hypothetical protein